MGDKAKIKKKKALEYSLEGLLLKVDLGFLEAQCWATHDARGKQIAHVGGAAG
jgi:hypothetical protein